MNLSTYRVICTYAGPSLLRPHPWPVAAVVPFPINAPAAVYVIDDNAGRCCYVGSVSRSLGGLADRMSEHLADPHKRARWHTAWVVPLRPQTSTSEIRRIEGVIGAHLGPYLSRHLPAPLPPLAPDALRPTGLLP